MKQRVLGWTMVRYVPDLALGSVTHQLCDMKSVPTCLPNFSILHTMGLSVLPQTRMVKIMYT